MPIFLGVSPMGAFLTRVERAGSIAEDRSGVTAARRSPHPASFSLASATTCSAVMPNA